ncbi:type B DNA-directed DNA polymerase [Halomarina rubra]|uniref:DNA-directed DNA polymerase n=1 Tax=Halomarina rubra TaxID=2071873 RepID=A0ABD6AW85_9EURY|nr:type B DNA-directed DNA polymerase [Halomarina rubra]
MVFKVDYRDGDVLRWSATASGASVDRDTEYTPALYVTAETPAAVGDVREHLERHPRVVRTVLESHRRGFRSDVEETLRVDVASIDDVTPVAHTVQGWGDPGTYRLYDVDFSREFRHCLDEGLSPVPDRDLRTLAIEATPRALAGETLGQVSVDSETVTGDDWTLATTVCDRIAERDPDVLVVNTAAVLARVNRLLGERPGEGDAYHLGRLPGFEQLAGRSTYESYGRVGHSPARYTVPGRVIIDRSNSFLWSETNLAGCLDMVERSGKPLQELGWASIGNVLTAMQVREARARDVLTPWHSWRHEQFKRAGQLHDADRGGTTLSPRVGVHEDVHELDFSSLYPNVIVTRNVSPETTRCDCHRGRPDVPGLDYAVCDEQGYLPEVLEPLVDDRDAIKARLRDCSDPEERAVLEGRSAAIKWVLVSCFGYQGFSNAKFGRIECHEAINAYAREILLDAKATLERNGWRVVHGIVDSLWVTAREDELQVPLDALCTAITDETGIRLEYEGRFDWVAFVPRRTSNTGALTKYFGRRADRRTDDPAAYKFRGIECRQRSTPPFVADVQRELIRVFDRTRSPEAVCTRLATRLADLRNGAVDPSELVVENRVSKTADEYVQATRNAAALERSASLGVAKHPGESVGYVVVDDDAAAPERVRLASEAPATYDTEFYAGLLVRAAESVCSPVGWREADVDAALAETTDRRLTDGEWGEREARGAQASRSDPQA